MPFQESDKKRQKRYENVSEINEGQIYSVLITKKSNCSYAFCNSGYSVKYTMYDL